MRNTHDRDHDFRSIEPSYEEFDSIHKLQDTMQCDHLWRTICRSMWPSSILCRLCSLWIVLRLLFVSPSCLEILNRVRRGPRASKCSQCDRRRIVVTLATSGWRKWQQPIWQCWDRGLGLFWISFCRSWKFIHHM